MVVLQGPSVHFPEIMSKNCMTAVHVGLVMTDATYNGNCGEKDYARAKFKFVIQ